MLPENGINLMFDVWEGVLQRPKYWKVGGFFDKITFTIIDKVCLHKCGHINMIIMKEGI